MVIINGCQKSEIDINDRGLLYGDGIFETVKVKGSVPKLLEMHLDRLILGCKLLDIPVPDLNRLRDEVGGVIESSGQNLVLKIIVTRGVGRRGYAYSGEETPTVVVMSSPEYVIDPNDHLQGVRAVICKTRLSHNIKLAGIKHLNRLEQVLARSEWKNPLIREGILLDYEGFVVEGTVSNIFIEKDGFLYTPQLDRAGVCGVVRRKIIEVFESESRPVRVKRITESELFAADSVAICNSLMGVIPLSQIDDKVFSIGPVLKSAIDKNLQDIDS